MLNRGPRPSAGDFLRVELNFAATNNSKFFQISNVNNPTLEILSDMWIQNGKGMTFKDGQVVGSSVGAASLFHGCC